MCPCVCRYEPRAGELDSREHWAAGNEVSRILKDTIWLTRDKTNVVDMKYLTKRFSRIVFNIMIKTLDRTLFVSDLYFLSIFY